MVWSLFFTPAAQCEAPAEEAPAEAAEETEEVAAEEEAPVRARARARRSNPRGVSLLYPSLATPCCLTALPHARGFLTRHLCASCACVSSGGACQAGNRGKRAHNCKATPQLTNFHGRCGLPGKGYFISPLLALANAR
jgi:hypothetical protein